MTQELIELITNKTDEGGSGFGVSRLLEANRCGRSARFSHDLRLGIDVPGYTPEEKPGALVGTNFHKLMEVWCGKSKLAIPLSDVNEDVVFTEALRLFNFFVGYHKRTDFGVIIETEMLLPRPGPQTGPDRAKIEKVFGGVGKHLTGRLDLVSLISEPQIALWQNRGLDVAEVGDYIVDWKTYKSNKASLEIDHKLSLQFMTYCMLLRTVYPNIHSVHGTIAVNIFKHKKLDPAKSLSYHFIPAPTEELQRETIAWLNMAYEKFLEGRHNLAGCIGKYGACYYWQLGICDRGQGYGTDYEGQPVVWEAPNSAPLCAG